MAILPLAPGQDYLRVSRAGLLLAPNDPHRGGAVCSARQVKRGGTAVPDIDGSVTNTEGLIWRFCMFRGWFEGFQRVAPPSGYASSAASVVGGGSRVAAVFCSVFRGA